MVYLAAFIITVKVLWCFVILIGTAYVVFGLGYSGWWWILSLILIAAASQGSDVNIKTR